jgi:ribosomal protein S4
MIITKKYRHRPVYKKFVNLRNNIQNRQKLIKFKKKKWENLLFKLNRNSKLQKRNCYYKFFDQNSYTISKYNNFFSKNYKQDVLTKKSFNLFYGGLRQNYLKTLVNKSIKKSNQIKSKINTKKFFCTFFEKRLDVSLVKSHFVLSIRNARQLISHKHVLVNQNIVTESSFLLSKGDLITFSKKSHKLIRYYLILSEVWPLPPTYLQISYKLFQIQVLDDITLSQNLLWLNLNNVIRSYRK